jgi:hypothetical protein
MPDGMQKHPYTKYEKTKAWESIKKSIQDLEKNQDISLTEWHEYIVGYICQQLDKDGLMKEKSIK